MHTVVLYIIDSSEPGRQAMQHFGTPALPLGCKFLLRKGVLATTLTLPFAGNISSCSNVDVPRLSTEWSPLKWEQLNGTRNCMQESGRLINSHSLACDHCQVNFRTIYIWCAVIVKSICTGIVVGSNFGWVSLLQSFEYLRWKWHSDFLWFMTICWKSPCHQVTIGCSSRMTLSIYNIWEIPWLDNLLCTYLLCEIFYGLLSLSCARLS